MNDTAMEENVFEIMQEKTYATPCGIIHYWVGKYDAPDKATLVFLPGLTADHRLFDKQLTYFKNSYNVLVWDAPGHAASWPFTFDFTLMDKARWLDEILIAEGLSHPVIIGQSMGGYVGQAYAELFPEKLKGFISIDSAPLQKCYVTGLERWLLKRMEPVYLYYPWKLLLKSGCNGVATSEYGRQLMHDIMVVYDGHQSRYAKLAGHGFKILAEAMEADLPYQLKCPALLICGEKDHAGSCIRYNKAWHKKTGIPIEWVKNAGHNSNTDAPEFVNQLIEDFMELNGIM
jgi:pimeloyl-ACP methyl ester carboxylesterase